MASSPRSSGLQGPSSQPEGQSRSGSVGGSVVQDSSAQGGLRRGTGQGSAMDASQRVGFPNASASVRTRSGKRHPPCPETPDPAAVVNCLKERSLADSSLSPPPRRATGRGGRWDRIAPPGCPVVHAERSSDDNPQSMPRSSAIVYSSADAQQRGGRPQLLGAVDGISSPRAHRMRAPGRPSKGPGDAQSQARTGAGEFPGAARLPDPSGRDAARADAHALGRPVLRHDPGGLRVKRASGNTSGSALFRRPPRVAAGVGYAAGERAPPDAASGGTCRRRAAPVRQAQCV